MRLKVTHYSNSRSRVISLAIWDMELAAVESAGAYMRILESDASVVDKVHALLMIADKVDRHAEREKSQRSSEVHDVHDHTALNTKESVSV